MNTLSRPVAALLLLFIAAPAAAQERSTVRLSMFAFAAAAAADDISTARGFSRHAVEKNPLLSFANNDPSTVVATLAITDALQLFLAHKFSKHHPRLVTTALLVSASFRASYAAHNFATIR